MKSAFLIKGGKPLEGKVEIRGSKNAASKMMIASLLTKDPCIIENVPRSLEIDITRELCESIGSTVEFIEDHTLRIETPSILKSFVTELSRKNRIPILALSPLLHRTGFAEIPVLGGCPIGHRPINFHIEALSKMGATIERRERSYFAKTQGLRGAEIEFLFPSVGATENVLLAAVLASGKTILRNGAVEPEIMNLVEMLRAMGARIDFYPEERRFEIEGVRELHGVTADVMPDRNEIVSFAAAALATGGEVFIPAIEASHLKTFLGVVENIGCSYTITIQKLDRGVTEVPRRGQTLDNLGNYGVSGIKFSGRPPYRPIFIETSPHPGFMTDWQQPMSVVLTQAGGESIIHETVYEDRFGYTKDLRRMGAEITLSDECPAENPCRFFRQTYNHVAKIVGPSRLWGTQIEVTDIRAGMAHIIAALIAEGESAITGIEHIDRGYEKIDERLRRLGADIRRVEDF